MVSEIRWVKLKQESSQKYGLTHGLSFEWLPVYWPPHTDPELGEFTSQSHLHVAFNRLDQGKRIELEQRARESMRRVAGFAVLAIDVAEVSNRAAPILSSNCAHQVSDDFAHLIWWPELASHRTDLNLAINRGAGVANRRKLKEKYASTEQQSGLF